MALKINLKKAVNHGVHGEHLSPLSDRVKTKDDIYLGIHPLSDSLKAPRLPFPVPSVFSVVSN
jgi:hypothetical protein